VTKLIDELCRSALIRIEKYIEKQFEDLHKLTAQEFAEARLRLLLNLGAESST
jgi:acetyl-CoA carboxylase alpha subunit